MGRWTDGLPGQAEALELPLDPTKEQASPLITVVIGVHDIAAVGCHPTRELSDQPRLIGADHLENRRGRRHESSQIGLSMTDDRWLNPANGHKRALTMGEAMPLPIPGAQYKTIKKMFSRAVPLQ